jgi:hypothetical protein
MRYRALVVLLLSAAAAHADDRVGQTADLVVAAVRDGAKATLQGLARPEHADPWLVAEELCFRGAHDAAAAFAAATPHDRNLEKLAAYVASRRDKEADTKARDALAAGQALRIKNYTRRAWDTLRKIRVADDAVLEIRVFTARAKTLRDLDEISRSQRNFLHAGKLAYDLGWRQRALESLSFVVYRYCFASASDSPVWATRRKLQQGDVAVVYGASHGKLLAAVMTKDRTWYVPFGEKAAVEASRACFPVPRPGVPVVVDALRARLVAPLELGQEVKRVFVVPITPFIDLPWVLLFGDREVVYGAGSVGVTAFRPWAGADGKGVLAVGLPRREGGTAAEQEARAVGDRFLVGDKATWAEIDEAAIKKPRWRALHLACPPAFAERWPEIHPLLRDWTPRSFWRWTRKWLAEGESDLVVLSVDESFRLVYRPTWERGFAPPAPRAIVSLWGVDPGATLALMRRFYELWNGKTPLPACTALKRAQDFVRSRAPWEHPYYWAGWQLWAARDPVDPEKGDG